MLSKIEAAMASRIPNRFTPIRTLHEDRRSTTFLAIDHVLEQPNVLVKVIRRGYFADDQAQLVRLFSWFKGVRHPQLASVLDAGITSNRNLYYVREYLPASQLSSTDDAAAMNKLLSVLGFLRSNGQVHGAIRPSNLFFSPGTLKLADPNVYRAHSGQSREDVRFDAPEILKGGKPTLESDLYSTGAILYRLLAKQDPFDDSDVDYLKSKYIWASPRSLADLCHVSKSVSDGVALLLDKDPAKRQTGFAILRQCWGVKFSPAIRAAFVGRESSLKIADEVLEHSPQRSLQVLLVDGEPGIGKTRFVEELRTRAAFKATTFVSACCPARTCSDFEPFLQGIRALLKAKAGGGHLNTELELGNFSPTLRRYFLPEADSKFNREYPIEKVTHDLVGLISSLSRHNHLIFVIEDFHCADRRTKQLVEEMCFRAAEVPLTLILTRRPSNQSFELSNFLGHCLGEDFTNIRLRGLREGESAGLLEFLKADGPARTAIAEVSAGNPLFIEEYARIEEDRPKDTPPAVNDAISSMLYNLTQPQRAVTEILSLFDRPIEIAMIAALSQQTSSAVQATVNELEHLGVAATLAARPYIKYEAERKRVYGTLRKSRKTSLHTSVFQYLKKGKPKGEFLAYHAFEAGLFREAGDQYLRLARQHLKSRNHATAVKLYEQAQECARHGGPELDGADKLDLANCYKWVAKHSKAYQLCQDLISSREYQNDVELLSRTYSVLANIYQRVPIAERIRLRELAIECLPKGSPKLQRRHANLCIALLHIGDLAGAASALKKAEDQSSADEMVNHARASFLMNVGNFRGAADILQARICNNDTKDLAVELNNLAVCFEHLGNIKKGYEYQLRAERVSLTNGILPVQIISLVNFGSMKTKLGEMRDAERYLLRGLRQIERLRNREKLLNAGIFMPGYADATLHYLQAGKYHQAAQCMKKLKAPVGSLLEGDRVFSNLARCEFYLQLGQTKKAQSVLRLLNDSASFKNAFFQSESTLIGARLSDPFREQTVRALEEALGTTQKLDTLYQKCRVLNELAAVLVSLDKRDKAQEYAKKALRLARTNGYKPLGARALLLTGLSSEKSRDKQLCLLGALQNADEIGLPELVAESAFHLGVFHLETRNYMTAREYLARSISITTGLAEQIPVSWRATYLAKPWRRNARKSLERCNTYLQANSHAAPVPSAGKEEHYFKSAYRLTIAAAAASNPEALLVTVTKTLEETLSRPAIVMLKSSDVVTTKAIRTKISDELIQRVQSIAQKAREHIYFGNPDKVPTKDTVAWIPLHSENTEGGVYVSCRSRQSPLSEREMEFLTILGTIANASLRRMEKQELETERTMAITEFHGIIGSSKAIRQVYAQIEIAATNAATVLIEGESGTGKELVARAIHETSHRSKNPFIAVDCGAIPETLIEAELFGTKKGAYTGAVADRPGLFEAADHGTIFLDEISNTSPALQAKLLRVLQERQVRRIGEIKDRTIDIRLIVASNANLDQLAREGHFRKDLLYRLNVLHIKVPALRNRRDDIPMLAQAFINRLNISNKTKKHLAHGVLDQICTHTFPGNVRELQNALERAFFSARGSVITEILIEGRVPETPTTDEVAIWFKELAAGRKDFWSAVHSRYKKRDISREKVIALVDLGLRSTRGSYKTMASMFNLKANEYRRFMDFLRRNDCLLDFRPYRKVTAQDK